MHERTHVSFSLCFIYFFSCIFFFYFETHTVCTCSCQEKVSIVGSDKKLVILCMLSVCGALMSQRCSGNATSVTQTAWCCHCRHKLPVVLASKCMPSPFFLFSFFFPRVLPLLHLLAINKQLYFANWTIKDSGKNTEQH